MATKMVRVKYNRTDNACALWEKHPDQPDGEVFCGPGFEGEIALTPLAEKAIGNRSLILASEAGASKSPSTPESETSGAIGGVTPEPEAAPNAEASPGRSRRDTGR